MVQYRRPTVREAAGRRAGAPPALELATSVESLNVIYDAGQNSASNHASVEAAGIGFVGSLPPSDHAGLLEIPTADYRALDQQRCPGLRCVDTRVRALGVTRRAVLTHSPTLHAAASRGFDQTMAKARPPPGRPPSHPGPRPNPPRTHWPCQSELAPL